MVCVSLADGVSNSALSAAAEIGGFVQVVGQIEDWESEYPELVAITRTDGLTELALVVGSTHVRDESRIGFMLARRSVARPFDAHHITLLQHLAAQAVVAVQNARAFNELQARNREVAEALEQQTATADLEVISRAPANLQAAFDAVVLNATRLLESEGAVVIRFMADGTAGWVAMANGGEIAPGPRLATPAPTPADAGSEAMAILLGSRTVMRHGGPDSIAADAPNLVRCGARAV